MLTIIDDLCVYDDRVKFAIMVTRHRHMDTDTWTQTHGTATRCKGMLARQGMTVKKRDGRGDVVLLNQ